MLARRALGDFLVRDAHTDGRGASRAPPLSQSIGFRCATICSRCGSRKDASTSFSPSVASWPDFVRRAAAVTLDAVEQLRAEEDVRADLAPFVR